MTQFKELEDLLKKITDGGDELKSLLGQAHGVMRDFKREIKASKDLILNTVAEEVGKMVGELADETRADMHATVDRVITSIETEWREKLGLDPK